MYDRVRVYERINFTVGTTRLGWLLFLTWRMLNFSNTPNLIMLHTKKNENVSTVLEIGTFSFKIFLPQLVHGFIFL